MDINLHILYLLNQIYFLLSNIKDSKYLEELLAIQQEFAIALDAFDMLEKDLMTNAPYKQCQYMELQNYEKSLEELKAKITQDINPKVNMTGNILAKFNHYITNLEERKVDLDCFLEITSYARKLIYNLDERVIKFLFQEVAYLFISTLNQIGLDKIEELVKKTNNYFYPSIILVAEHYLLKVMSLDEKEKEELVTYQKHSREEYLMYLYKKANQKGIFNQELLFLRATNAETDEEKVVRN